LSCACIDSRAASVTKKIPAIAIITPKKYAAISVSIQNAHLHSHSHSAKLRGQKKKMIKN
jgi:hypothetical protein